MNKGKRLKIATSNYLFFACHSWLLQIQHSMPASDILKWSFSKYQIHVSDLFWCCSAFYVVNPCCFSVLKALIL